MLWKIRTLTWYQQPRVFPTQPSHPAAAAAPGRPAFSFSPSFLFHLLSSPPHLPLGANRASSAAPTCSRPSTSASAAADAAAALTARAGQTGAAEDPGAEDVAPTTENPLLHAGAHTGDLLARAGDAPARAGDALDGPSAAAIAAYARAAAAAAAAGLGMPVDGAGALAVAAGALPRGLTSTLAGVGGLPPAAAPFPAPPPPPVAHRPDSPSSPLSSLLVLRLRRAGPACVRPLSLGSASATRLTP